MIDRKIILFFVTVFLFGCNYGCEHKNANTQSNKEIIDPITLDKIKKLESYSPLESSMFVIKFQNHLGKELVTFSNLKCLNINEQYSGYLLIDGKTLVIQDTSKFGFQYYDNAKIKRNIPDNFWCSDYNFDSTFSLLYIKFDSVFYRYGASANFSKLNIQINDSTENPDFLF